MRWLKIDPFLLLIISAVILATLFPCQGEWQTFFKHLTTLAIALLFFMHGAKLSFTAIMNGIRHWRLHIAIFSATFILFPLLGLAMQVFETRLISPTIYNGFLFLCTLPATVQAAIAYTSIARGNIPAAICSASASTLLGIIVSPLLVGLLIHTHASQSHMWEAILSVTYKLFLPFIAGHLSRPLIGKWIDQHRKLVGRTDRSSVLLVVYVAFSEAVVNGIWQQVSLQTLLLIMLLSLLLLTVVLGLTTLMAHWLKFNKEDEITLVFCGSKKSLASGIPIANTLFPAATVGMMVLPLMIFHQIQLMVCAILAARYAKRPTTDSE